MPVGIIGKSMPFHDRYSLLQIQAHYLKAGHNMDSTLHTFRNSFYISPHIILKKERFQIILLTFLTFICCDSKQLFVLQCVNDQRDVQFL